MSERGVFAVDRGIWSDPDFPNEPFSEREAFLWLVSEAAWRPTKVRVGARVIELERGQCSFSTRFMAAKFLWSEARVRRFLQRRSDLNQVCTKTDAGATRVTICKYDAFQRVGKVSDAPATQERRTSDAKKKQGNRETDISEAEASSIAARERAQIDRDFVAFWQIFPRREAKGNAEKAYAKAREAASADEVFAGAQHYALQRAGQDRRYTRLPASWLNGKGWLDEKPDNVVPLGRPRDLREIRDPVERARYQSF